MSAFTPGQIAYLESLPAVEHVTATRIRYTDAFRRECLRAYGQGAHPVDLFRRAGLDPRIVGYKRIERAFARWRRESGTPAVRSAGRPPLDGMKPDAAESGATKPGDGCEATMPISSALGGMRPSVSTDGNGEMLFPPVVDDNGANNGRPHRSAVSGPAAFGGMDPRDLLIVQQMHYIHYLEGQLQRLQNPV